MPIPAGPITAYTGWDAYRPPTSPIGDVFIELDKWFAPGVDDYGVEWNLTNLDGWAGTPAVRNAGQERPQEHGEFDAPNYYGPRILTVDGSAIAPTREAALFAQDMLGSLTAWNPQSLSILRVTEPGRPKRQCRVRLTAPIKIDPLGGYAFDFSMQFKAPDPRRYADRIDFVALSAPGAATGGLTVPVTAPVTVAGVSGPRSAYTLTNAGTASTRPLVTFLGPLVDPQIAHVGSGRSLSLSITLTSDDALVADFGRRTISLNGSAGRTGALTASAAWWELTPGSNDVRFTAGGGDGIASVVWRSAWV